MLQQKEHDIVPVEEQVVCIYAVTSGLVDDIEADNIPDWEQQFREHMRNSHEEILSNIRESQEFSDEDEDNVKEAIEKFNEGYEPQDTSIVQIGEEDDGEDENDSEEEG
jgi:F-type H+-transporting ATPase subunit alpha